MTRRKKDHWLYQNRHFYLGQYKFGRLNLDFDRRGFFKAFVVIFNWQLLCNSGRQDAFTLYLGFNAKSRGRYCRFTYRRIVPECPLQIGITRDANEVPYVSNSVQHLVVHARNFGRHA